MVLALAGAAEAQTATTGQIAGAISDPTGAVIAGAKITITSEAGVRRDLVSDGTGRYRVPQLPPGNYRMQVAAPGFAGAKVGPIIVNITTTTVQDVTLKVGGQESVVEVTGAAPLLQTDSAATGKVIEQDTIAQLPLPTRNFQQLLTLSSGTNGSLQNSSSLGRGDATISVNGNRTTSNSVVVNGVDANSVGTGSTPNLAVPATDTLQEFIVQTSLYDATQGRNAGGVVAAVTKGGTNEFHGNFYEFLRNTKLNANDYFLKNDDIPRQPYRRNQFGGTIGGPIRKDRVWFFGSYQETRETNYTSLDNSLSTVFVPNYVTDDRSATGLNNIMMGATGLPGYFMSPVAANILQAKLPNGKYLLPSSQGQASGAVTTPTESTYREHQGNANLDVQLTPVNHLAAKVFLANNPTVQGLYNFAGVGNALQVPGAAASFNMHQRVYTVSDTHLIGSNLVNLGTFGFSSIMGKFTPQEPFTASGFGITTPLQSLYPGAPTISVIDGFDLGPSPLEDNFSYVATYTYSDMLTWTHGHHTLKMGGEFKRQVVNFYFNAYTRGQMYFANFASLVAGAPLLTLQGSGVEDRNIRANDFSGFVQEDWKVNDRLSVNAGLRYDLFNPFYDTKGRMVAFDPALAQLTPVAGINVLTAGFVQASNGSMPGIPKVQKGLVDTRYTNFAPRLGFAFRPIAQDHSLVLRGGYGLYYDRMNARLFNSQVFNAPYDIIAMNLYTLTATGAVATTPSMTDPFVHVPLPSAFPVAFNNSSYFPLGGGPWILPATNLSYSTFTSSTTPTIVPLSGIYPDRHNFKTPYVGQYNLGIQWELAKNVVADVSYVGSSGRRLTQLHDRNQQVLNSDPYSGPFWPALSGLANPALGAYVESTSGSSNYNSLQVSLTGRNFKGLSGLFSYTYGHSIDDYSGGDVNDLDGMPGNTLLNYFASSDFDRRQRLVFSGTYDLPKFYKGSDGWRYAANGWQLDTIVTLQTGTPFSIVGTSSIFANTFGECKPGRTVGSAKGSGSIESRLDSYFDTSAFQQPAAFTTDFGNLRNVLIGPPQKNVDLSVVKFFPITEHQRVEFRGELFNLFNHPNFANPVNIMTSSGFGSIVRTSTGPRVVQFAMKINY